MEQVSEHLCRWYQAALFGLLKKPQPKLHFWDEQKMFDIATWEQLYDLLAKHRRLFPSPIPNQVPDLCLPRDNFTARRRVILWSDVNFLLFARGISPKTGQNLLKFY
ncbi:MAG: hypothetical protein OXH84_01655 [Gammaproteobacteria bacterium]|nr:hypothetical protein [Gammaproteobacteria bacterium]